MEPTFRALVVAKDTADFSIGVRELRQEDLPPGEVVVRVAYSDVNYKDGLACIPTGQIVRNYPFVPGIDLAGAVEVSTDARYAPGQAVIVTSYGLGVAHFGGFSQFARVPADWIVPLPAGLTLREAMALGTAGFTAALAVHQLEALELRPGDQPVLVTGATGGVGSVAVALLAHLGYPVAASTGKVDAHAYLRQLGATTIVDRTELAGESTRPLDKERWAGAIDAVGGTTLASVLRTLRYGTSVAACGLTGGGAVATTVFPFILRGVNLLGIDSVQCPMALRLTIWQKLATIWKLPLLDTIIAREVSLTEVPAVAEQIRAGALRGRVLVNPQL